MAMYYNAGTMCGLIAQHATAEQAGFVLYCLLGPAVWIYMGWVMFRVRRQMMLLRSGAGMKPAGRVTVMVPAKDEQGQIGRCIESILSQDYPDFIVIAINDRSTDNTGKVLDDLAARDSRLRVVHVKHLPKGWTGKNNALVSALEYADGAWLVFIDADVVLEKGALAAVMDFAADGRGDLFSLLPRVRSEGFWESLLTPLCGMVVNSISLVAVTNVKRRPNVAWANGQFLVVRRSVYDAIGGHASVRDCIGEDVGLARKAKALGFKTRVAVGTQYAAVRMYDSLSSLLRGWTRNFYTGSFGRPWKLLAAMTFIAACCFSVIAALAWGTYRTQQWDDPFYRWAWVIAGGAHLVVMMAMLVIMYGWSGMRRAYALLFPLGAAMVMGILLGSLRTCLRGQVAWRGTHYSRMWRPGQ